MVQVKPNWHDSSDLIGYVSRINGEKYVVGPFLRFIAKAIQDPKRPYFLCLDEMNLPELVKPVLEPVQLFEQYCLIKDFFDGVNIKKATLKSQDFHDQSAPKQTFESLVNNNKTQQ